MILQAKNLDTPDDQRGSEHGAMAVVTLDGTTIVRGVLDPGWRWSRDVQPTVGTDSCQVAHTSYLISGRFGVRLDDGTTLELGPGDAASVPPGHDAWVIGDQPCVLIDFAATTPTESPAAGTGRRAACPCGVEFRITSADYAQREHLIAAVAQHAAGSHGHHGVTREHILGELIPT